jgi:hypothetical protein
VLAISNDGMIQYWAPDGTRAVTAEVAQGTLVVRREVPVDLRSGVRDGESVSTHSLRPGPGDGLIMLTLTAPAPGENLRRPTGLLLVELADGRLVRRLDLPASDHTTGAGVWSPEAALPAGILAVHAAPDRTEVMRLDDVSGAVSVLSTLPRDSLVVLRGTKRS